ncbi:bromodomain domain-containing protein, partial [Cyclospora cayetanensis]
MAMLSPEQRRAALELIQDDLGILASDHMLDSTFSFDTELLSIEKQKRLFAYVNSMARANRELLISRGLLGGPPTGEVQGAPPG